MPSRHRSIGLDVLRAVAVLMVLVRHAEPCPAGSSGWGHAVWQHLQRGGWAGVDLFFVLSGFLVGGLLFHEFHETGTLKFGRFFIRRAFKIYPPFWVFLGFLIAWSFRTRGFVGPLLPEVFFYQNYVRGIWGTNWSLAVEEHFYLLLPAVLLCLAAVRGAERPFLQFPRLFGLLAVVCFALRAWNASNPYDEYTHLTPTHLRLDGLFFGAVLAYYHTYEHERFVAFCRRHGRWLLAGGVAAFLPAYLLPLEESLFMQIGGFALHWLGAGALVCFTLSRTTVPGKTARALAAIGRTSYATYLWHFWISRIGFPALAQIAGFEWNWTIRTVCYFIATLGAGFLLTAYIERPFLWLRDQQFPRGDNETMRQ
ncbi:MAG TPA: acyltransferase [Chthoniobacteraceae bacterium]|nr:acyltransferase [Chthoniobacteraceae bacterium]